MGLLLVIAHSFNQEFYGPVPYQPPPLEPRWTSETLPPFPTIAMVSEAFKLNFWQRDI